MGQNRGFSTEHKKVGTPYTMEHNMKKVGTPYTWPWGYGVPTFYGVPKNYGTPWCMVYHNIAAARGGVSGVALKELPTSISV